MSGSKAKQLRREIYRDYSHRNTKRKRLDTGQVVCIGLRKRYKQAKKDEING